MNNNPSKRRLGAVLVLVLTSVSAAPVPVQGLGKPGPTCDVISVNLSLRDAAGDSVLSDGTGVPYPASLNCANEVNNLSLISERGFAFELRSPTDPTEGFMLSSGVVGANLGISIADEGGIAEMEVPSSAPTTKIQFNFVVGNKRYFLSWGSNYPGASTALVTRTSTDRWMIETSDTVTETMPNPNNIARLRECPAKGTCKAPVDRFYYAPVRMDLYAAP